MIRVAIVEDNVTDVVRLKDCLKYYTEKDGVEFLVDAYGSALPFLMNDKVKYDIVFFDIEMPNMNGLEAAHKLRDVDKFVQIIFVTNLAQLAIKGYEVDALDFVVKPIDKYDFYSKMKRAVARCANKENDSVLVHTENGLITLAVSDITYLEVSGHYVVFHTIEGKYSEYSTLKSAIDRLKGNKNFVACNRCYVVNFRYVQAISANFVTVYGEDLMISRAKKKPFVDAYAAYISGK